MGTLPPAPAKLTLILIPFLAPDLPFLLREAHQNLNLPEITTMSSSTYSVVFENRYAAFIIWCAFIMAFIVVPFAFVPCKVLFARLCGFLCFARRRQAEDFDDGCPIYSIFDVEYNYLSHSKKNQIHEIRTREISKRLTVFSTVVSPENMVPRQSLQDDPDKVEYDNEQERDASSQDFIGVEDSKETLDEKDKPVVQVKEGAISNDDTQVSTDEASSEAHFASENFYTHIRLPHPGYNKNGRRKVKKKSKQRVKPGNVQRIRLALSRRKKDAIKGRGKKLVDEEYNAEMEDGIQVRNDWRDVPLSCAVCLGEFEIAEKVCWSSNPQCTHVFHHHCMLQWLKVLGKRASKQQRFSDNPSVNQVLNFSMECPCCRQSFIDKSVDYDDVGGDDDDV